MTGAPHVVPETLRLLIFSAGGLRFAADADQAATIADYGESDDAIPRFNDAAGVTGSPADCPSPCVLTLKGEAAGLSVIISHPEEVVTLPIADIRPIPPLLAPHAAERGIWGVFPLRGKMVLLVDFRRLLTPKAPHTSL